MNRGYGQVRRRILLLPEGENQQALKENQVGPNANWRKTVEGDSYGLR